MDYFSDQEKKAFIRNLRKHRDRVFPGWGGNGLLAKAADISPQSLSQWISGKRVPSPEHVYALAKALGVDARELCGRSKVKADAPGDDLPEIVKGQIAAIDTLILMLRHNKRALLGETDAKRHKEGVRIIKQLLEKELDDKQTNGAI